MMSLTEQDLIDLKEGLRRCSPETVEAAVRFRERGDVAAIPQVVYGILERYQPATATVKLSDAGDNARLIEDIGLDSLTLLEIVMSIEEVIRLHIENDELREIRTLGSLKKFLHNKITATRTGTPAKQYTREHIALVLPQQPPFLFLDDAELNGETIKASYTIKGTEFFLEGHFKDDPIFPASIVFEAMGQSACLWLLEKAPGLLGKEIKTNHVYFASMDGAHFYRKTRPGEKLEFEQKLVKLREPLAVFEGSVTCQGQRVARIERLTLAFGEQSPVETPAVAEDPVVLEPAAELAPASNGQS